MYRDLHVGPAELLRAAVSAGSATTSCAWGKP